MTLNQFLWWPCDTYWVKERIQYIQQNGNFVLEGTFMKFSKGCISFHMRLTLHLPRKVLCYNFVASQLIVNHFSGTSQTLVKLGKFAKKHFRTTTGFIYIFH